MISENDLALFAMVLCTLSRQKIEFCHAVETFQKLELEKKKSRVHRQTYSGPVIRYHSVTVPVVDELSTVDAEINVDSDTVDRSVDFSSHCN